MIASLPTRSPTFAERAVPGFANGDLGDGHIVGVYSRSLPTVVLLKPEPLGR